MAESGKSPLSKAVESGPLATIAYGARYAWHWTFSTCSLRSVKKLAELRGQATAERITGESPLAKLAEKLGTETSMPTAPDIDTAEKQLDRTSHIKFALYAAMAGVIFFPTEWTYSTQTRAALIGASTLKIALSVANNTVTNTVLSGREIGNYVYDFLYFALTYVTGES